MTYADTAVIVLTCVTIIITCAALVIGMLGIFGYQKLKHDACEASVASALIRIESEMGDGGVLKKLLEERGDEILANYNRKRTRSEDWGKEETEYGE